MSRWLVMGLALSLFAGCKKQKDLEPPVPTVDPAELAEAAWARVVPATQRATFGLKVDSPTMNSNGLATGALVVDRPDRFRLEIYAPIIGPRFYAVSDGEAVNLYVVSEKLWLSGPDAEGVLREATGGTAGLKDVVDLLTGRMPFEDAEVTGVALLEGETQYTFEGPSGTRAVVAVDARTLATRSVEAFNEAGEAVLRATYSEYVAQGAVLMPESVTIEIPTMAMTLELNFKSWDPLEEVPDAFSLSKPGGATERDLLELIQEWAAKRGE